MQRFNTLRPRQDGPIFLTTFLNAFLSLLAHARSEDIQLVQRRLWSCNSLWWVTAMGAATGTTDLVCGIFLPVAVCMSTFANSSASKHVTEAKLAWKVVCVTFDNLIRHFFKILSLEWMTMDFKASVALKLFQCLLRNDHLCSDVEIIDRRLELGRFRRYLMKIW